MYEHVATGIDKTESDIMDSADLIHTQCECLIKPDCHWDPWASAAPHL